MKVYCEYCEDEIKGEVFSEDWVENLCEACYYGCSWRGAVTWIQFMIKNNQKMDIN